MARMWLNVDIEFETEDPDSPDLGDKDRILQILHLLLKDQILDIKVQPDKMFEDDESVIDHIRYIVEQRSQGSLNRGTTTDQY